MLRILATLSVMTGAVVGTAVAQSNATDEEMSATCEAYAIAHHKPEQVSVASNGNFGPGIFSFNVSASVGGQNLAFRCIVDQDTNSVASFDAQ